MPKTILVVDDYRHSREGLKNSLGGGGDTVETAADSLEAITKMKEGRFDVAILNLDLPPVRGVAVNGWDLVRIFRAFNPSVSIIVVGSEWGNGAKAEAELLEVSEILEKPIAPARLKAIVRTLDPCARRKRSRGMMRVFKSMLSLALAALLLVPLSAAAEERKLEITVPPSAAEPGVVPGPGEAVRRSRPREADLRPENIRVEHDPAFVGPLSTTVSVGSGPPVRAGLSAWIAPRGPGDRLTVRENSGWVAIGVSIGWP